MLRRYLLPLLCLILTLVFAFPVNAHANLLRSDPVANERLEQTPDIIQLYFSEPLESNFSRIEIRNAQGEVLDMPAAELSPDDPTLLTLIPTNVPDGVYTVAWRVVSQTDGHMTQGSFPFTVGTASAVSQSLSTIADDRIPIESSMIRWFNLLSLGWLVGSAAFWLFIWLPSDFDRHERVEKRLRYLIWIAWWSVVFSSLLIVLLQAQIVSGSDWVNAIAHAQAVITSTRFGQLWMIRLVLWAIFGLMLWKMPQASQMTHIALLVTGAGMLITQSLFSHASGTVDAASAVVADWLHLLAMSLWLGGLVQLVAVTLLMRTQVKDLSRLVAHFSNLARVCVAILVVTGAYAAWIHVGSIDAFLTTQYGQAMLVKLALFMPVLLLGAINLLLTRKGLSKGKAIWSKRLQYLVAAEIVLIIAMIAAVGVMTAIAPARITLAAREAIPPAPETDPYFEMVIQDDLMVHLTIEPGIVGENSFYVDLFDDETLTAIDDASLIRLRFEHETENLGESELRPQLQDDGRYLVTGSNLSVAGDWQIRMTIQRPDEFDTVIDFEPSIGSPQPIPVPDFNPMPAQFSRGIALLLTGVVGIVIASTFLFLHRPLNLRPLTVLIIIFMSGSILLLQRGATLLLPETVATAPLELDANQPIQMTVHSSANLPWLLTQDGVVLRPNEDESWTELGIDGAHINDIDLEANNRLWAASDNGLYLFDDETWHQQGDFASEHLAITHGYVYAMGMGNILRVGEGAIETDSRNLDIPESDAEAEQFVMLGNHSHILLNGDDLFLTSSLGLGWQALDAPDNVQAVTIDADGNLLAATQSELLRWRWNDQRWQVITDLPVNNAAVSELVVLENRVYLLTQNRLYTYVGGAWQAIMIMDRERLILDIANQFPDTLWALDSEQNLWALNQSGWEHVTTIEGG